MTTFSYSRRFGVPAYLADATTLLAFILAGAAVLAVVGGYLLNVFQHSNPCHPVLAGTLIGAGLTALVVTQYLDIPRKCGTGVLESAMHMQVLGTVAGTLSGWHIGRTRLPVATAST